jgi:hypothetical protein
MAMLFLDLVKTLALTNDGGQLLAGARANNPTTSVCDQETVKRSMLTRQNKTKIEGEDQNAEQIPRYMNPHCPMPLHYVV